MSPPRFFCSSRRPASLHSPVTVPPPTLRLASQPARHAAAYPARLLKQHGTHPHRLRQSRKDNKASDKKEARGQRRELSQGRGRKGISGGRGRRASYATCGSRPGTSRDRFSHGSIYEYNEALGRSRGRWRPARPNNRPSRNRNSIRPTTSALRSGPNGTLNP